MNDLFILNSKHQTMRVINPTLLYIVKRCFSLYVVGLMVLIIGEIWMRLPATPSGIQYTFDEELGYRYVPNQVASSRMMGIFALERPPMVIDEDGFRNSVVDWNRPVILALGSSEVVGPGLKEEEIWTTRLTQQLSNGSEKDPLVYNAATGGYGPYHSSVVLRRYIKKYKKPVLVIARVSLGDRLFLPFTSDQLREEKLKKERRDLIKTYTLFIPFLYNKVQLQLDSIRSILSVYRPRNVSTREYETAESAERMWEQNKKYWYEIASICKEMNIPVLFVVYDPYGTVAGQLLFKIFTTHFSNEQCELVLLLGRAQFGLFQEDLSERRNVFRLKYTFKIDPHGNSLQHKIIADTLFQYLKKTNLPLNGNLSCSSSNRFH